MYVPVVASTVNTPFSTSTADCAPVPRSTTYAYLSFFETLRREISLIVVEPCAGITTRESL